MPVRSAARTPVWAKTLALGVVGLLATWWLVDRHDRVTNQHRLAAIATDIARRPVEVRCPGPVGRIMTPAETTAGAVYTDADGNLPDETKLREPVCEELDALAEGRRGAQLACAARSTSCAEDVRSLAWAVNTLAHEAFHLRGILDEALTECYAMQSLAQTAERLGAAPGQAHGLAVLHWESSPTEKPEQYQVPAGCADGGRHDLRKADPAWP